MENELIRLLKLAQGDRSLNAFARHADISPGNLSRIMKGQKATPETLKKIANKAHNNISYEQLMIAAGYINNDDKETKNTNIPKEHKNSKLINSSKLKVTSPEKLQKSEKSSLIDEIETLSSESKKELEKYIKLLKLKDTMDKSKEEQSATSEQDA